MFLWLSLMTRCPPFASGKLRQTVSDKRLCAGDLRVSSLLVSRFQVPTRKDVSVYVFSTQRLALMQTGQEPTQLIWMRTLLSSSLGCEVSDKISSFPINAMGSRVFPRMSLSSPWGFNSCLNPPSLFSQRWLFHGVRRLQVDPNKATNMVAAQWMISMFGISSGQASPPIFQVPWYFLEGVTVDLACWVRISSWPVLIPEQQCFALKLTKANTCTFPLAKQSSPFHRLPEPTL